jgi:GTPase SAR1 family protein
VVLVIGQDGCGKSALLNSLISGPETMYRDPKDGTVEAKGWLTHQGLPKFVINSGMKSEVPEMYEKNGILFLEAPRTIKDNVLWGTVDTKIQELYSHAKATVILLVIEGT